MDDLSYYYDRIETVPIENFGWDHSNKRIQLFEPCETPERRPLISGTEDYAPKFIERWHNTRKKEPSADLNGVGVFFARDVRLFRQGNISLDTKYLVDERFMPLYLKNLLGISDGDFSKLQEADRCEYEVIKEPTVVLSGHGIGVYGHFVIEMLFRLLLVERLKSFGMPFEPKFAIEATAPTWLKNILFEHFQIDQSRIVQYHPGKFGLHLEKAIIPEYMYASGRGGYHPASASLLRELSSKVADAAEMDAPRLFFSRAFFSNRVARWKCLNEQELLTISVQKFGFYPFYPERLSWRTQIRFIRGARTIVGEFGSAMHNSAFAASTLNVGCIGVANWMQSEIDTVVGNRNAYFDADTTGHFQIDIKKFEEYLDALVCSEN